MGSVRAAGRVFFPLDEELELLPGGLTPVLHEHVVRLGSWMPFRSAAKLVGDLLHVQISEPTVRRYTEAGGAAYVAIQTEQVEWIESMRPAEPETPERLVFSVDGAMVPLCHGEWAEARTLVMAEAGEALQHGEEWQTKTHKHSYFSRLVNSETFQRLALAETFRRGLTRSPQVAAVADGAEWIQGFIDYHRPDALRILDFPHVAEHLNQVGIACWGENSPEGRQWLSDQLKQLKRHGPTSVLAKVHTLVQQHPDNDRLQTHANYLEKRQAQMDYPQYQQQGWPIGSGMVESANKLVVEARLKGSGMHWQRKHVDPMLALRNIVCSERWQAAWPLIEARIRQLHANRHRPPPDQSSPQIPIRKLSKLRRMHLPPLPPTDPSQPPSRKPAPNHPWRRSPIGRALYQPHPLSKK
jgi:hypothetical protein